MLTSSSVRPKVSVIVPVYNVAKYIEKCARSIFGQTLDSLEIIFVNDCTPDNSVEIIYRVLKNYPNRKVQTIVINNPSNTGQAGVRRIGILASKGEYIIHCDGDDWIDLDLYERMYETAVSTNADMAICNVIDETIKGSSKRSLEKTEQLGRDIIKDWYKNPISLYCWNKLIKREIIIKNNLLPWDGLNLWEDNGLISRILYYTNKTVYIPDAFYHYNRLNNTSITSRYGLKETNQMIKIAQNLEKFFSQKTDYDEFVKTINAFKYLSKLNLITDSFKNYKEYRSLFPESNKIKNEIPYRAFSKRGKIRFSMVKYGCAPLFILMFKIKNMIKQ